MAYVTRIVLLGKSGTGKSSLGNTILRDPHAFRVDHSSNSDPSPCRSVTRTIHGRTITLIDTPGLYNNKMDPLHSFSPEIMKCLEHSAPGPHAFLLVLKKENITSQECDGVDLILHHFSAEALRFTTVVITRGDELQPGERIEGWAQGSDYLREKVLRRCGNRCHVVDNVRWGGQPAHQHDYRNNQNQVQALLDTIDRMVVENGGSHFTSALMTNPSLWERFREAPVGIQIAAILGVGAAICLLCSTVPWASVVLWVMEGVKHGAAWVWANLPTVEEGIKHAIIYFIPIYRLFIRIHPTTEDASASSSSCAVM